MPTAPEHAPAHDSDARREFSWAEVTARSGGQLSAELRVGVAVARFNGAITRNLFAGAVQALVDAGVQAERIHAVVVPGAIEVPLALQQLHETHDCDALIALACVIRGDTAHFDYVCSFITDGCRELTLRDGIPVGFGVITCDTAEQAHDRSSAPGTGPNVGTDAARAALELAALFPGS